MIDIQRRNDAAFAEFYRLTKVKLFATTVMIIPNTHIAEDVVQEVYVRFWNKAESYDPTKSSAITWLGTFGAT